MVVDWESRSSGFINSCTLVSFAIVALNANMCRLKDSYCRFQSHFVGIVTFLGMFIKNREKRLLAS
jgi:hypothetical protein